MSPRKVSGLFGTLRAAQRPWQGAMHRPTVSLRRLQRLPERPLPLG